jgi:hypothetical protein
MNRNLREKAIVLDLARRAALALFSSGEQRLALPHDEDALWCEDRHPVMNERPCESVVKLVVLLADFDDTRQGLDRFS